MAIIQDKFFTRAVLKNMASGLNRSSTLSPSLNPPYNIASPINRRHLWKTAIIIRFCGGHVIIKTVMLAIIHTLSGKCNMYVVPGFSLSIHTYPISTNMEFLSHPWLEIYGRSTR